MQGCHIQETGEWLSQETTMWRLRTGSRSSLVAQSSHTLKQKLLSPPTGRNLLTVRADHRFKGQDSKFYLHKGAPTQASPLEGLRLQRVLDEHFSKFRHHQRFPSLFYD